MGNTINLSIKPLTQELISDYLDFFDNRAFTDGNPNGPCYCTSANQTKDEIEKMVSEFKDNGYVAVEGYSKIYDGYNAYDYQGPAGLYEKSGFIEVARQDGQIIMRKIL